MQVNKELLDKEIEAMKAQIEQIKTSAAQAAGALAVLQGMRAYLDKEEEPKVEEAIVGEPIAETVEIPEDLKTKISDENKAIQEAVEKRRPSFVKIVQDAEEEVLDATGLTAGDHLNG